MLWASWLVAVGSQLVPLALSAQDTVFNSNGVPIHYIERGQGEAVVLIHGNGGSVDLWLGSGVFDSLAKDYRVIALDCRGFGRSGRPHEPKQYGREMGLDVIRLLDHLKVSRAHIAGYSMGAEITAQLLTTHPARFLTATLGGAAGTFKWTRERAELAEQEAMEWERGIAGGPARYSVVLETWPTDTPKPSPESIRQRGEAALANPNFDRMAQAAVTRGRADRVITARDAAAVTVPTLAIAGSADPRVADLQELKRLRPGVTLVVIEGATHSGARGAVRRPEFLSALRDFLRANRQ